MKDLGLLCIGKIELGVAVDEAHGNNGDFLSSSWPLGTCRTERKTGIDEPELSEAVGFTVFSMLEGMERLHLYD